MKSGFLSRRHRNPQQNHEPEKEQPFFSKSSDQEKQPFFQAGAHSGNGQTIQAKLSIGQPGDKYEQEADKVANQVVSGQNQTPVLQRQEISTLQRATLATPQEDEKLSTAESRMEKDKLIQEKPEVQREQMPEEEKPVQKMDHPEEEEPLVQPKAETGGNTTASAHLSNRIQDSTGKGRTLSENTRAEMEQVFGTDFSRVNIHTDSDAVQMNKELGAQAFTHGKDLYFNAGKYNPENTSGKRLLAHELTHVVQQGGGGLNQKKIQKVPGPSFPHKLLKDIKFANWWNNFPSGSIDDVKKKIGGKVYADWITNSCAIRMSRVMNYSGFPISYQKEKTISGGDKKWYYFRIKDLKPFIESQLGAPDFTFHPSYDMSEFSSLKGIILFDVKVWPDATGHFTLWDGRTCKDKCYFDEASKVYLWVP